MVSPLRVLDARIPMRDGTELAADVFVREDDTSRPVLLMRTPYGRGMLRATQDPVQMARTGWAVVIQDVRGRFDSAGTFRPFVGEIDDGFDSIEWCSRQSWSDGNVVMTGASYMGAVQWLAAAAGHPALKALAPTTTTASFRDHWSRLGGAAQHDFLRWWTTGFELTSAGSVSAQDLHDALLGDLPDVDPAGVGLPAFHVAGWYDIFCEGAIDSYRRAAAAWPDRHRLVVGPWAHTGVFQRFTPHADFGPMADGLLLGLPLAQLAFLNAAARGEPVPTGVSVFRLGGCDWVELDSWPPPGVLRQLWLTPEGGLENDPGVTQACLDWQHDAEDPVPTWGGRTLGVDLLNCGPRPQGQVEERSDVRVFTSAVLDGDMELMGEVRLQAPFGSTAESADLVVMLCSVDPDGTSTNLVDGVLRVADAWTESVRNVLVGNVAALVPAGSRLRLQVAGSSAPQYDVQPSGRHTLRVGSADGARLDLPVRD